MSKLQRQAGSLAHFPSTPRQRAPPQLSLGRAARLPYARRVIVLLRLICVLNLAVWFGACVFFTVGVAPALFSDEMKGLLQQSYPALSGRLAILLISRYYLLHYWCAALALLHQLAERFYLGKPLQRITLGLLIGLCIFSLLGGLWLQPKLKKLHAAQYGRSDLYSLTQRSQAATSFKTWHGGP